jgi:LmbE family N-acetylglucosaminyl deacetylase
MIVPVVGEAEWTNALRDLPEFVPVIGRVLVVAPHPDDETLGAGGLIAALCDRGGEVLVAAVTDGERAYLDEPKLAEVRRQEQREALAVLGVESDKIHRFQLPDSDVASCEEELAYRLTPLVTANTYILAPWGADYHPDHEACGRVAKQIAATTGATLISYLFWTWHRGTTADLVGLQLAAFALTTELLSTKLRALSRYRSQLVHPSGEPILPDTLLAPAKRSFEVFVRA